jgi:hypothetical protein
MIILSLKHKDAIKPHTSFKQNIFVTYTWQQICFTALKQEMIFTKFAWTLVVAHVVSSKKWSYHFHILSEHVISPTFCIMDCNCNCIPKDLSSMSPSSWTFSFTYRSSNLISNQSCTEVLLICHSFWNGVLRTLESGFSLLLSPLSAGNEQQDGCMLWMYDTSP